MNGASSLAEDASSTPPARRVGHEGHRPEPGVFGVHDVSLEPGSVVQVVLGDTVTVKSYHHQGVADAGSLSVAGRADDQTVEVVEIPGRRGPLSAGGAFVGADVRRIHHPRRVRSSASGRRMRRCLTRAG